MWAYGHLPNQTIRSESAWLSVLFSLSLVTNALATCAFVTSILELCVLTDLAS